jgi:PAS domain-containing protein
LQVILDSLGDGVIVANEGGELVVFNPAAERMLRKGASDAPPGQWSEVYSCYKPDAATRYPPQELPLAPAMRGEEVDEVEVFVRPDDLPNDYC